MVKESDSSKSKMEQLRKMTSRQISKFANLKLRKLKSRFDLHKLIFPTHEVIDVDLNHHNKILMPFKIWRIISLKSIFSSS